MSLYIINNLLGDDSRYPTISHKKCFVPDANMLDFIGEILEVIYIYIHTHFR